MTENNRSKSDNSDIIVRDIHRLFLEALRQREQDIIRFLAILGPAIAGYIWLMYNFSSNKLDVFVYGTIGILILLDIGAWYSIALGYNYRYITLQLAKIEVCLKIRKYILNSWPREISDFQKCLCIPPEIIKVFWFAFIVFISAITVSASIKLHLYSDSIIIISVGSLLLLKAIYMPFHYGSKLSKKCSYEGNMLECKDE